MEASLLRVCEDFSNQGYEDWSFKIKICLEAHHILIWDFIENGPSPILGENVEITGAAPGQPTYKQELKDPRTYTTEEEKKLDWTTLQKALSPAQSKKYILPKSET